MKMTLRQALLLCSTCLLPAIVAVPGGRWLLPFLAPLTLYSAFARRVGERDYVGAWRLGMVWAGLLSAGVIALVIALPEVAKAGILNGEPYRQEMFQWIATGLGRENNPAAFLPEHLLHLSLFVLLTYLTGGYLGLVLGSALVAYMSYFVGNYAVAADSWVFGSIVAWVPWSVVRVAAFVLLGALFARPLLVGRRWPFSGLEGRLMALGGAGILTDMTVKTLLAPRYGLFLRQLADGAL
ncbi:MAG: hypothetical protein AAF604_21975 [Acidobacteriota bacterium]